MDIKKYLKILKDFSNKKEKALMVTRNNKNNQKFIKQFDGFIEWNKKKDSEKEKVVDFLLKLNTDFENKKNSNRNHK